MAVPNREQLANNAFTTLDGAILAGDTTITVVDGSVFPAVGNFRLLIGDEILLCTARSTNDLTVVRGQEGTAAAGASSGANVAHVLTAGGLTRWVQDNLGLFGYSGSRPLGRLVANDGSTILTSADFTWVNQGTATASDQNGTIAMRAPFASNENVRALALNAPATPYAYIMALRGIGIRENFQVMGVGFRESSSGKLTLLSFVADASDSLRLAIYKYNGPTSFNSRMLSESNTLFVGDDVWFKIEDDGTNITYYMSCDGIEFIEVASEARGTFFSGSGGPDQVFWGLNNSGSDEYEMVARLSHWSLE